MIYEDVIESSLLDGCFVNIKTWDSDDYGWITFVRYDKKSKTSSYFYADFIELRTYNSKEEAQIGHKNIVEKYQ